MDGLSVKLWHAEVIALKCTDAQVRPDEIHCYHSVHQRNSMILLYIQMAEMTQLLMSSETFDWAGLTVDAYRKAAFWFVQVCQAPWVLAQRSSLPAVGFR